MNGKLALLCITALGAGALFAFGCQTYDFEPVTPLAVAQTTQSKTVIAKQLHPDLMLLVDKSGSMLFPTNPSAPNCTANCGPGAPCPANCPTRISELRAAMQTFLGQNGKVARFGMAQFPSDAVCGATASVASDLPARDVEDDTRLQAQANQVLNLINQLQPGGGTPTAASLRFLSNVPSLQDPDREDFVVLLTDGLPNCNPQNPNTCSNAAACKCTQTSCSGGSCTIGCLDQANSVQAVRDLQKNKIRTIVIGFGADFTTGDAVTVLNELAQEGGFARACPTGSNNDCTPGTCDQNTKLCTTKFYQANSAASLAAALAQISALVGGGDPCVYTLEAQPSDPKFLAVFIDGVNTAAGADTWNYSAGKVTFTGALCSKVSAATPSQPVKVEFRIVEGL